MKNLKERVLAASNPNLPEKVLAVLAESAYWQIRAAVAQNPNASEQTLALLAKDEVEEVRTAVEANSLERKNVKIQVID